MPETVNIQRKKGYLATVSKIPVQVLADHSFAPLVKHVRRHSLGVHPKASCLPHKQEAKREREQRRDQGSKGPFCNGAAVTERPPSRPHIPNVLPPPNSTVPGTTSQHMDCCGGAFNVQTTATVHCYLWHWTDLNLNAVLVTYKKYEFSA